MHRSVCSILSTLVFVFTFLLTASAKTIHVPADQPTIQAGIDAAKNGDVVMVSPGTYFENVNFNGKRITVRSAKGPAKTTIDGQQSGSGVTFSSGESRKSLLKGFTLRNETYGGAVAVNSSSPTIQGNIFTQSGSCGNGIGINSYNGSPAIEGNIINNSNSPNCGGTGIYSEFDNGIRIVGNIISNNGASGIYLYFSYDFTIQANVIAGNAATGINIYYPQTNAGTIVQNLISSNQASGVYWSDPPALVANNTIVANTPNDYSPQGSQIGAGNMNGQLTLANNLLVGDGAWSALYCNDYDASNPPIFENNDVFSSGGTAYGGACPDLTGIQGNISVDPLFASFLGNDFHIQPGSLAIDAGTNGVSGLPLKDFDGDDRVINGTIDIGADEQSQTTKVTFSPLSLRYNEEQVGKTSPAQAVILANNGNNNVAIRLVATSSDYTQSNDCGESLAPGTNCQIKVHFTPVGGGPRRGVLGIFTAAAPNPFMVSLLGQGLAPQVSFDTNGFYFNGVIVGTQAQQSATLTNTGQAPLVISDIALSGSADLSEANDCPVAPAKLKPGLSCTITVTWTPVAPENVSGQVTITDNAIPSPQVLNVNGYSYSAGIATLTPDQLTFPDTLIGNTSSPQRLMLTNTGTGTLGNIQVSSGYSEFPYQTDCTQSLVPGASCNVDVSFAPDYAGMSNGWLYVYNDSPNQPTAALSGNGIAPLPTVSSLSPSGAPVGSYDTYITITGTGFVNGTQVYFDDVLMATYCCSPTTEFNFYLPQSYFQQAKTAQVHVTNPAPGGGDSNTVAFTVYTPINYAFKSTAYRYNKITGTNLNLSYFSGTHVTSPFPIQFGGGSYTDLTVGAGGTISFNGFYYEYNDGIPTTQTPMLIAPFWTNLYPWGTGADNNVFWAVDGTAPNRKLIIEWRNVAYCCTTDTRYTVTFQTVFFEGESNILFNYADTIFGGPYSNNDNGATATAGVQVAPNLGTQFSYNTPSIMSKTSLLWYPDQPTAIVSTNLLDFGYHVIGTWSLPQKLTLTNGGLVPLNINSIATDSADFAQTNNCGTMLAPHKSCTIHVKFKPSQASGESATLTIDDDAIGGPQHVTLNGTGAIQPIVTFPLTLHFGGVQVGQKNTLPVTLANAANTNLSIEQITASPNVYTQTNNCGTSLAPGLYCTINVTFAPTQKGQINGKLSMGLNGKPVADKAKLVGSGK